MKESHEFFSNELIEPEEWVTPVIGETKPGEVHFRTVSILESGWRLDLFLAHHFPNYSRTLVRAAIQNGGVCIDPEDEKPTAG
ncbi:MAG: hypothetical protein LBK82_01510, partial [Planctomycetaceae bacterium]|nr:hypothetical protein [Planctomycetaceae bacterium]